MKKNISATENTETQSKHTPGPWIAEMPKGIILGPGAVPLAAVFDNPDTGAEHMGEEPSTANARLIAVAPDMLAALLRLVRTTELNLDELEPETISAIAQAVRVIAKAWGES